MSDYWLGFFTLPALAALALGIIAAGVYAIGWLLRRGIDFDFNLKRELDVSAYTIQRDICWEHSHGIWRFRPVFTGGWFRDWPMDGPRLGRWIGIGSADGPNAMVIRTQRVPEGKR
jgi:hypothetical protein